MEKSSDRIKSEFSLLKISPQGRDEMVLVSE